MDKQAEHLMLCYFMKPVDESKMDEPLAMSSLAGALIREFGETIQVSQHHVQVLGINGILESIQKTRPQILASSLFFDSLSYFVLVMECVDSLPSDYRPIVLIGNVMATNNYELLLQKYPALNCCLGEGEETIVEFVRYYRGEVGLEDIPNLAYRLESGAIIRNPSRPVDMKKLAPPYRIFTERVLASGGILFMEGSRGCPHNCSICARIDFLQDKSWRAKEIDALLAEIVLASGQGAGAVNFVDEDFGIRPISELEYFAQRILQLKKKGVLSRTFSFSCSMSVRTIISRRHILRLLVQAGLKFVCYGIESGSTSQLTRFAKSATVEENLVAFRALHDNGVAGLATIIMFDPLSTIEEVKNNLDFLETSGIEQHVTYPFKSFDPMKGAGYTRTLFELGLADPNSYNPDFGFYEYWYKDTRVALLLRAIKEWEVTQYPFFFLLKMIYRSSDYFRLPKAAQRKIKEAIEEQALLCFKFLKELVRSNCSWPEIDLKYSKLLLQQMGDILSQPDLQIMPIVRKKLPTLLDQGVIRETIRLSFRDSVFSIKDVITSALKRFEHKLAISTVQSSFRSMLRGAKLHRLGALYSVNSKFWSFPNLHYGAIPRPALSEKDSAIGILELSGRCITQNFK